MAARSDAGPGGAPSGQDRRVVVIDDDEVILLSCQEVLTRSGYRVEAYSNGEEGLGRIAQSPPPVLVVDLKMPRIDGFQVIARVREMEPRTVIIVITGYATIATAVDAMKAGAYDFVPKPFTPEELRLIVARAHERWSLAHESEKLRLEKARVERRFITFVTHQLKSPLAAVKQYLDVLMFSSAAQLPERALAWIQRSQVRIAEMTDLIRDWLDLSRIEQGELCRPQEAAELEPLVRAVAEALAPHAEAAGVTLQLQLEPGLDPVAGDGESLSMLLHNLLGNAVKYNRPGGEVRVRAARRPAHVELAVQDTGIGIPQEHMGRLFAEFYRVKSKAAEKIPGTGLGLAICKRVVTELGGSIAVASEEGVGTTFTVQLRTATGCRQPGAGTETKMPAEVKR